ncbi:hypothetical protein EIN_348200 [Entamoeba invadens IP1]|uniref:Rab-GAP TBC domain-containing protein n=1 Tax=Entamoeba invadens IP1 TaxID=370355 RepID=L7FPA7_ENTIV|nr:hypothetical protein EIN_348200 [Entamoeba invadens IP1]ELP90234.1 hypothetical protein EIN_348200 [Entamoeba invadens IP1]|eukprot:XP_004257005.1 hypothetical protein EIN_348200 [Entamoeba invadens IP1]
MLGEVFDLKNNGAANYTNKLFGVLELVNKKQFDRLNELGIIPTTFGLRWVRMLFSREFTIENTIKLWDGIFSYGHAMSLIKSIYLVLLLDCCQEEDDGILMRLMHDPAKNYTNIENLLRDSIAFDQRHRHVLNI